MKGGISRRSIHIFFGQKKRKGGRRRGGRASEKEKCAERVLWKGASSFFHANAHGHKTDESVYDASERGGMRMRRLSR